MVSFSALTQVYTDANVFFLFITKFAAKLTKENKNWRDTTILSARYKTYTGSFRHMKALGLKVCISVPYSCSIEYAFGSFMSVDLNPSCLKG